MYTLIRTAANAERHQSSALCITALSECVTVPKCNYLDAAAMAEMVNEGTCASLGVSDAAMNMIITTNCCAQEFQDQDRQQLQDLKLKKIFTTAQSPFALYEPIGIAKQLLDTQSKV